MEFSFSDEPQILRVFNFDQVTGEFIGESDCYVAANTGLPVGCVLDAVPQALEGKARVWTGKVWKRVDDYRGLTIWSTETRLPVTYDVLGKLPATLTTLEPSSEFDRWTGKEWAPDVKAAKEAQITAIKNHRDTVTADYIVIDGNHFHSDTDSRIQQMTLTKMGQAGMVPPGLMWQTKNNGLIELTNEIAAQFESVTIEHDMRLFATAQGYISAVEALTDFDAVMSYDWSQGWQP